MLQVEDTTIYDMLQFQKFRSYGYKTTEQGSRE